MRRLIWNDKPLMTISHLYQILARRLDTPRDVDIAIARLTLLPAAIPALQMLALMARPEFPGQKAMMMLPLLHKSTSSEVYPPNATSDTLLSPFFAGKKLHKGKRAAEKQPQAGA